MEKTRIVIVDDSSFSIAVIRDILEENGFEVVGTAGNLEEVKQVVADTRPSLVTMDMTLPGTDGLECTRAIHEIDEDVKVIVISSMMDDEIVKKAKKTRVSTYIQKPIDADELVTAINRIMAAEELYIFLQAEYLAVFKEALLDSVNRMTKTLLTYQDEYFSEEEYASEDMTVIVGIIGEFSGCMLLGISKETARDLTTVILKKQPANNDELAAALSEFANIVSGNACSMLNRKRKELGLRVAPPSVLYGQNILISPPNFKTTTAIAETVFGEILLNIGFKRSEKRWM